MEIPKTTMRLQINIHGGKNVAEQLGAEIEEIPHEKLERFGNLFTWLELHIARNKDVNLRMDIYRRGIEGRTAGKSPIKVHHPARRSDLAAQGAVVKFITATERRGAGKLTVRCKSHVL
jgi:hypothetical protein